MVTLLLLGNRLFPMSLSLFSGNEPDRGVRLYVQEVEGGTPKAITPEGMHASAFLVSPGGQSVVVSVPTS